MLTSPYVLAQLYVLPENSNVIPTELRVET